MKNGRTPQTEWNLSRAYPAVCRLTLLLTLFSAAALSAWDAPEQAWRLRLEQPFPGSAYPLVCEVAPDWEKLTEAAGTPISPEQLRCYADGRELALRFRKEGARIAFTLPAPCKTLHLYFGGPSREIPADNTRELLPNALAPGQWEGNASADAVSQGLLFTTPDSARSGTRRTISRDFPLPADAAGRKAIFEPTLTSQAKLPWGGSIRLRQLDAENRELPDSVTDPRWISLMRPFAKEVSHRETGWLDPRAKKLRLVFRFKDQEQRYDLRGLPLKNADDDAPRLLVSRLDLRAAEELPFPGWSDDLFAPGVTGEPGDAAFRFDGFSAFFFPLSPQALWAEGIQPPLTEWFWPVGDGVAEVWIRPEWGAKDGPRTLLNAYAWHRKDSRRNLFSLSYHPAKQELTLYLKDFQNREFTRSVKQTLPPNEWRHLAAQWSAQSGVRLYVDGKCVLRDPEWRFAALDAGSCEKPDTMMPQQLSLGLTGPTARARFQNSQLPAFKGQMDRLRIYDGARYPESFTPLRTPGNDIEARAAFDFDRSFEGVSANGGRRLWAAVAARTPRLADTMTVEAKDGSRRAIRLRPAENTRRNTPEVVLDANNYPDLPVTADFRRARKVEQQEFMLAPGGKLLIQLRDPVTMDFIELAVPPNAPPLVSPIVLRPDEIDPRSYADIAESMKLALLPERDRADRLFNFLLGASDYFMSYQVYFEPGSNAPREVVYRALSMLNGYCGFECGPLNNLAANLFCGSGQMPAVQTGGYAHSFEQVFYDGKLHLYDLSAQKFFPSTDRKSAASLDELEHELLPFGTVEPPASADHFIRMFHRNYWEHVPSLFARSAYTLRPGESFRIWFGNNGGYNDLQSDYIKRFPGATDMRAATNAAAPVWRIDRAFPHYSNAFLRFDGKPLAKHPAFTPSPEGGFVYRVSLPYPVISGRFRAEEKGEALPLELSTDGGKSWRPLEIGEDGFATPEYEIRARQEFHIRVNAPLKKVSRFRAETRVMLNSRLLTGSLLPGGKYASAQSRLGFAVSNHHAIPHRRRRARREGRRQLGSHPRLGETAGARGSG